MVRRGQGTVHEYYNVEWIKVPSAGTVQAALEFKNVNWSEEEGEHVTHLLCFAPSLLSRTFVYCTGARVPPETQFVRFREIRNFGEIHHCFR